MMEVMNLIKSIAFVFVSNLFFLFKQQSPPRQTPEAAAASSSVATAAVTDLERMQLEEVHPLQAEATARHNSNDLSPVEVVDWGKTILEFCLMTAIALIPLSFQTDLHLSPSFYVFCVLILLAFVSSFAGILFRKKLPIVAAVLEKMGITFAVLAFLWAWRCPLIHQVSSGSLGLCVLSPAFRPSFTTA